MARRNLITFCMACISMTLTIVLCMSKCYGNKQLTDDTKTEDDNIESFETMEGFKTIETIEEIKTIEIETENQTTIDTESDKEVDTDKAVQPISLGEFKLTAYCSCQKCCGKYALNRPLDENGNEIVYGSIGERLVSGVSIAVDPNVIPYRTEVIINGHTYVAHDTGGLINDNRIDVYFNDHQSALNFGVQYAEVFIVRN